MVIGLLLILYIRDTSFSWENWEDFFDQKGQRTIKLKIVKM